MGDDSEGSRQLFFDDPLSQRRLNENGPVRQKLGARRSSVNLAKAFHRRTYIIKKQRKEGVIERALMVMIPG